MDYGYAKTDAPTAQPLDPAIRMLAEAASGLAAEVRTLSNRIHGVGSGSVGAAIGASGAVPVQGWADDMRDMVTNSRLSAEAAMKEACRIRETLGL